MHLYILVRPGVKQKVQKMLMPLSIIISAKNWNRSCIPLQGSEKRRNHFIYPVMPLTDIHLHSDKSYEIEANGNITYVYIFSVIAIFILLIACVNFMNLSTARSANRAKEVGIRKVAGSLRSHLITQFLTESVLLSFFSLLMALGYQHCCSFVQPACRKKMHVGTLFSTWLFPV